MQDGSVRAFGQNSHGQLGLGDSNNRGGNPGEMGANLPPVPQTLSEVSTGASQLLEAWVQGFGIRVSGPGLSYQGF